MVWVKTCTTLGQDRNSSGFWALAEGCFGSSSDKRMNLNSSDVCICLSKESHEKLFFFSMYD